MRTAQQTQRPDRESGVQPELRLDLCSPIILTVERIGDLLDYDLAALLADQQSVQISPEVTR